MNDADKRKAAESVSGLMEDGMIIGLGTGSTAAFAIRKIGELVKEGLHILAVTTSFQSETLAIQSGIQLTSLAEHPTLDLAIDGADQIDSQLNVIKGGAGAHTKEKVVAFASNKFVICVDETKVADVLSKPVPLEVLPYARSIVEKEIRAIDGIPRIRKSNGYPLITENGNIIIDADLGKIENPKEMNTCLSSFVGVVEHGLFINEYVSEIHVGGKDGVTIIGRKKGHNPIP